MTDLQRMRKYGTFEEDNDPMIRFRQKLDAKRLVPTRSGSKGGDAGGGDGGGGGGGGSLEEGNPLARMVALGKQGRHFGVVSTERPGLTKKEVRGRNRELVKMARAEGFGVRRAEGHYEGGKESSHLIHAKGSGREGGAELVGFLRKAGKHFGQDSVFHHNGQTARLIGTNETGFPGMNKSEKVGTKLRYNNPESEFQTELRPGKKSSPARFTT